MAPRLISCACETASALDPRDAAQEANHRIANNLAIIAGYVRSELSSLGRGTADFLPVRQSLQQLSLRIDAIGRLHRLLTTSPRGSSVEICTYLREITDAAKCSLSRTDAPQIIFSSDVEVLVPAIQAVVIGAIVAEALLNTAKYSHPPGDTGTVWIICSRSKPGRLLIEIADDGTEWRREPDGEKSRNSGIGTQLMGKLAVSLKAQLEIVRAKPGQVVRLELPLSDPSLQ
jgi:two-component sensor histidine kinase